MLYINLDVSVSPRQSSVAILKGNDISPSDLKNQCYQDLQLKMTSDPAPSYGARERARMQEYIDNGVKLGWLIEPKTKTVEIYRLGKSVELLNNPKSISGEDILPGFVLDLSKIFS